ncbi:MAG: hypothetical protein QF472_02445 [Candidatus Marinimicrobia bacterium]|nr:hypothetical protein [Candidatus Neomarinimicrobiota bacterium]
MKITFLTLFILSQLLIGRDFAYPLSEGQRSNGVFQPKIYGLKNEFEISTHPILFLIKPNVKVKKYLGENYGMGMAVRTSLDYPTPLLKLLQRKKIGGMLADDPAVGKVPFLLLLSCEILATKKLGDKHFTGKVGLSLCPGCELDERHIIDLPLAYPRMAVYHSGIGTNFGVDYDFSINEKLKLKTDLDLLIIPNKTLFTEHKLLVTYPLSEKYNLSAGYKFVNGVYPFSQGDSRWDFYPLFDLSWQWE